MHAGEPKGAILSQLADMTPYLHTMLKCGLTREEIYESFADMEYIRPQPCDHKTAEKIAMCNEYGLIAAAACNDWRCNREYLLSAGEKELCRYCGSGADTKDHIVPKRFGGDDAAENIVPACRTCNCRKNTLPVNVFQLNGHDRSMWLKNRQWLKDGKSWLHQRFSWLDKYGDRHWVRFTKAAALRAAAFPDAFIKTER